MQQTFVFPYCHRAPAVALTRAGRRTRGFTLIELMVSMVIGLLVVLAAVAALLVARNGFTATDAASQLRDNARFAVLALDRIGVQSGFKDVAFATVTDPNDASITTNYPAPITGFSNASLSQGATNLSAATVTALTSGSVGYGSDVLIMRFQPASSLPTTGSTATDQSMIDCFGDSPANVSTIASNNYVSVFSINADATGEPTLFCSHPLDASGKLTYVTDSQATANSYSSTALIRGVELFKVLYGVDSGVTPNTAPATAASAPLDSVPKRYLTADQMLVRSDEAATASNWRRVRSIRIGMILRSDAGAVEMPQTQTLYPFGAAKSGAAAATGSAFVDSANINSQFSAPADGRLRQVVTFTIHLRNDQGGR